LDKPKEQNMSATSYSVVTNWFKVRDVAAVQAVVDKMAASQEGREGLGGEVMTLHQRGDEIRLTMYEITDGTLDYWDEEAGEDIYLSGVLEEQFTDDTVMEMTEITWLKGEISFICQNVQTSKGSFSMGLAEINDLAAKKLGVDRSRLSN